MVGPDGELQIGQGLDHFVLSLEVRSIDDAIALVHMLCALCSC